MSDFEELIAELRSALTHLDDPIRLENHPLTKRISFVAQAADLSKGQLLRRTLRLAIEALDPSPGTPVGSAGGRSYQVLHRYAIGKKSVIAIAAELNISERQAYRELRSATEALAQIVLRGDPRAGPGKVPSTGILSRATSVREEVERLSGASSLELNLTQLVTVIVDSAQYLAREKGVEIQLQADEPNLQVTGNRVMLRQAFLNLLSYIAHVHRNDRIVVRLYRSGMDAVIEFTYHSETSPSAFDLESPYAVASQLFASMGLRWTRSEVDDGTIQIVVSIPLAREYRLLVVDDNEGLIVLFMRYLRHLPCEVYGANNADKALEMLERVHPDVIILDVMMPDRDGWELLETLRLRSSGCGPRVIVCSIINDPELSAALGADGFLHKPVSRESLLQALEEVISTT